MFSTQNSSKFAVNMADLSDPASKFTHSADQNSIILSPNNSTRVSILYSARRLVRLTISSDRFFVFDIIQRVNQRLKILPHPNLTGKQHDN